jgi:hypothetical protein
MVEITLPLVLQIVQTMGILVGIIYYLTIMRNAQKARQTQMFMELYRSSTTIEEMDRFWQLMALSWDDYDDFMNKWGPEINRGEASARTVMYNMFDGLGLLVKDRMVDVNTVYRLMGRRIIMMWFKFETIIKGLRDRNDPGPDYAENFEYLANVMIKMRHEKGLPLPVSRLHQTSELLEEYNP